MTDEDGAQTYFNDDGEEVMRSEPVTFDSTPLSLPSSFRLGGDVFEDKRPKPKPEGPPAPSRFDRDDVI